MVVGGGGVVSLGKFLFCMKPLRMLSTWTAKLFKFFFLSRTIAALPFDKGCNFSSSSSSNSNNTQQYFADVFLPQTLQEDALCSLV